MGDEVIKVLKYLENNDFIKGLTIGYIAVAIVSFIAVIIVFIITFRLIMKIKKNIDNAFKGDE